MCQKLIWVIGPWNPFRAGPRTEVGCHKWVPGSNDTNQLLAQNVWSKWSCLAFVPSELNRSGSCMELNLGLYHQMVSTWVGSGVNDEKLISDMLFLMQKRPNGFGSVPFRELLCFHDGDLGPLVRGERGVWQSWCHGTNWSEGPQWALKCQHYLIGSVFP